MKQYIILISAIILIISLNIFQASYLKNTSKELLNRIDNIKTNLDEKDFETAYNEILELEKDWETKRDGWDILTEHDDVEEFESCLASLKAFIKSNTLSESLSEVSKLKQRIEHILENESLSFATIF